MRTWVSLLACACLTACGGGGGDGGDAGGTDSTSGESSSSTTGESESGATETGESETGETGEPEGNLFLSDRVLNIAHRGGGRLRPEATLIAFENALAVGADVIEMDLHASADGVIVVIHDDTVDRTTDGSGVVNEMSFDELRMLDAGYEFTPDGGQTFPYRGMGVVIPSLEEVLDAFPDSYYLMEIKQYEPSIVADVLGVLEDHAVGDRVVIASFDQATIEEVRVLGPQMYTAMTLGETVDFYTMGAEPGYEPPCLFVQPPWDGVDQQRLDNAHALGLKVHAWTINTEALMVDLIDLGVDGIMTDDPALLDTVLGG